MTTVQSCKGFDSNTDSFRDIDTFNVNRTQFFRMTDVMIELNRFVK